MHRGAFCQFPFRSIYYCHSSKSNGKETDKTHICVLYLCETPFLHYKFSFCLRCTCLYRLGHLTMWTAGLGCRKKTLYISPAYCLHYLASITLWKPCLWSLWIMSPKKTANSLWKGTTYFFWACLYNLCIRKYLTIEISC